jgi:predicted RND superfamily exporter protein
MTSNMKSVSSSNETQKNSRSSKSVSRSNKDQKQSISSNQNNKNLIYHVNKSTEEKRLRISSECVPNILVIAHEREQGHSDFEVTFEIISRSWLFIAMNQSLMKTWNAITCWSRHWTFEFLIRFLLIDLSFSLVLENRITSFHYCREHAHDY